MNNAEMIPNRFARMAKAKKLRAKIEETFARNGVVVVATYTRATTYKSLDWFKFDRFNAYVRHGKHWDCIDGCGFRFGVPRAEG
jgi:hypothetical protein